MHSFHPSRGRILFETLCALAISASCAGAWVQTGASAFLPAAFVTALYGLWHLTDMRGRRPAVVAGGAALAGEGQADLLDIETVAPVVVPAPEIEVFEAGLAAPPAKRRSRKKQAEPAIVEQAVAEESSPASEPEDVPEEHHAQIAPLFEAQPLARQPRPVFGRKAG